MFVGFQKVEAILDEIEVEEKYDNATNHAIISSNEHDRKEDDNNDDDEEQEDKKKTAQFWKTLENKFKSGDMEFIKELIRKNEIKMDEFNGQHRNLLMISTQYGSYEIVCFLPIIIYSIILFLF